MAVMPKLQISAFESYPLCLMTSGDIQYGVPTNVFFLVIVAVSCPETPKSASLTAKDGRRKRVAKATGHSCEDVPSPDALNKTFAAVNEGISAFL
jgi:hypothetical protein